MPKQVTQKERQLSILLSSYLEKWQVSGLKEIRQQSKEAKSTPGEVGQSENLSELSLPPGLRNSPPSAVSTAAPAWPGLKPESGETKSKSKAKGHKQGYDMSFVKRGTDSTAGLHPGLPPLQLHLPAPSSPTSLHAPAEHPDHHGAISSRRDTAWIGTRRL